MRKDCRHVVDVHLEVGWVCCVNINALFALWQDQKACIWLGAPGAEFRMNT